MLPVGPLLHSLLRAAPDVAALVGTRVYPVRLAQGAALPAVAYQQVSAPAPRRTRGCVLPATPRYQLSLFARTYAELDALDKAVQAALDGYEAPGVAIAYVNGFDQHDDRSEVYFRPTDYTVELS